MTGVGSSVLLHAPLYIKVNSIYDVDIVSANNTYKYSVIKAYGGFIAITNKIKSKVTFNDTYSTYTEGVAMAGGSIFCLDCSSVSIIGDPEEVTFNKSKGFLGGALFFLQDYSSTITLNVDSCTFLSSNGFEGGSGGSIFFN
jgi:hypothetical protein